LSHVLPLKDLLLDRGAENAQVDGLPLTELGLVE